MNPHLNGLLQNLREAIHEALAESEGIAQAMAALDQAGHCPTFKVDIDTPAELEISGQAIELAGFDEQFLKALGITS